jgi:hypothetical protein
MIDLGTLGGFSIAQPVNDAGEVVGYSDNPMQTAWPGIAWTMRAGMIDLGTLGGANSDAVAVERLRRDRERVRCERRAVRGGIADQIASCPAVA